MTREEAEKIGRFAVACITGLEAHARREADRARIKEGGYVDLPPATEKPKEPTKAEPLYQSAIDDLKAWAHPQGNPGLLRGAIAHLEASLEQRKNE